jgi:maleate cis-trans isomerase
LARLPEKTETVAETKTPSETAASVKIAKSLGVRRRQLFGRYKHNTEKQVAEFQNNID